MRCAARLMRRCVRLAAIRVWAAPCAVSQDQTQPWIALEDTGVEAVGDFSARCRKEIRTEWARGALPGLLPIRFPGPIAEPGFCQRCSTMPRHTRIPAAVRHISLLRQADGGGLFPPPEATAPHGVDTAN